MDNAFDRDPVLLNAIVNKDVDSIKTIFFGEGKDFSRVKDGFCHESDLWDYKCEPPNPTRSADNEKGWADFAAIVLAFYNNRGGVLIFGVQDKTFAVSAVRTTLDSKLFNEKLRKYISDRIWVEFQRIDIRADQRSLCVLLIPARIDRLERFSNAGQGHRYAFSSRQSAIREGDSVRILSEGEVLVRTRQLALPTIDNPYEVDAPYFRLLRPEFSRFVYRDVPCNAVKAALRDPRTSIVSITGIGGAGKTALANWATHLAYEERAFKFIVSITAKDRALTTTGIVSLSPELSTFESLLDAVLAVLGFDEFLMLPLEEKRTNVMSLIEGSGGLLFIDNLETVDDARIIDFLEELPIGVKAITTSRIPRVKNLVRSIDPGFLTDAEIQEFVLGHKQDKPWVASLKPAQLREIGAAADGVPLAIEWIIRRAPSAHEALLLARSVKESGARKDELLEFCFRRVFDAMEDHEKLVLQTLACVSSPLGLEPIMAATNLGIKTMDVLDTLLDDSLVQRIFDENSGTYRFTLLALVRSFVASDLVLRVELDRGLRKRLTEWFDALDVKDMSLRVVERQLRQGKQTSDIMLVELGEQAERIDDLAGAKVFFERAYRVSSNWKAAWRLAEIARHKDEDTLSALRWYEKAAVSAPKTGPERALVFREYGNVLKNSGEPQAIEQAINRFEEALRHSDDRLAAHSLASLCARKGSYRRVIQLKPLLWDKADLETKYRSYNILVEALGKMSENIQLAEIKAEFEKLPERRQGSVSRQWASSRR